MRKITEFENSQTFQCYLWLWRCVLCVGSSEICHVHAIEQANEYIFAEKVSSHPRNSREWRLVIYVFRDFFSDNSRFLYPGICALMVATISYPLGTGQFIAGELSTHQQVHELFTNFTWTASELTVEQATIVNHWSTSYTDVFFHLSAYLAFTVTYNLE